MKHSLAIVSFVFVIFFSAPLLVLAQEGPQACGAGLPSCPTGSTCGTGGLCVTTSSGPGSGVTLVNPLNVGDCTPDTCLSIFLGKILDVVITIGSIVVMLMLVYIGYLFVVAQGSDTKLSEAKQALLWTIIGALILIGAKAIQVGITATVQALSAGS